MSLTSPIAARAVVETAFADVIDGALAHMPSGRFSTNSAWTICAAITHKVMRAASTLTSSSTMTVARLTLTNRSTRPNPRNKKQWKS